MRMTGPMATWSIGMIFSSEVSGIIQLIKVTA